MKAYIIIFLLSIISHFLNSQVQVVGKCVYRNNLSFTGPCHENTYDDYALILYDEFDKDSLNYDIWQYTGRTANGKCADATTFFNRRGNVKIQNGKLNLSLLSDQKTLACQPWDNPPEQHSFLYSGGWLESVMNYAYGKFEVKFKVSQINNINPAFWLYGPNKNEIDVFEFFTNNTVNGLNNRKIQHTTYSTGGYNLTGLDPAQDRCQYKSDFTLPQNISDFATSFHTATMEWSPNRIVWMIDGVETFRLTSFHDMNSGNPWECSLNSPSVLYRLLSYPNYTMDYNGPDPYYMSMQVILDIAQFGGTPNNLPGKLEVEYVKIWSPIYCPLTLNLNGNVSNPKVNYLKNDWIAGNINCSSDPNQGMTILNHIAGPGYSRNSITLVASNEISFLPGFGCEENAYMSAAISPCDNDKSNRQINHSEHSEPVVKNIDFTELSKRSEQKLKEDKNDTYGNYIPYPNPTGNKFRITNLSDFKNSEMSIYNNVGQKINTIKIATGEEEIDLLNYMNGIYLIKIEGLGTAIRISKFD